MTQRKFTVTRSGTYYTLNAWMEGGMLALELIKQYPQQSDEKQSVTFTANSVAEFSQTLSELIRDLQAVHEQADQLGNR